MIGKVSRSSGAGGLLDYLFGPGEDHEDAHLVACWDNDVALQEPPMDPARPGRRAVDGLARVLSAPLALTLHPPRREVWHCSLRNHKQDRVLTDAEWAEAAREVLDATGIAARGDEEGCRWIAVRHSPSHVHVVAVLVDQTGATVAARNDYYAVSRACRRMEVRYGLTATAAADRTAAPQPSRTEHRRHGNDHARHPRAKLRQEVRIAAAATSDPEAFFQRLADQQLQVRPRYAPDGAVLGYAVAWPGDRVWFGGAKLGRDLSLPKLRARWAAPGGPAAGAVVDPAERRAVLTRTARTARRTADALSAGQVDGDGVAHATGDVLAVTARITAGHQDTPLRRAAEGYDRAARAPGVPVPPVDPYGRELRRLARQLAALGRLDDRAERSGAVELVAALTVLVIAVAAYQQARQRTAQATAARVAADQLHAARATLSPPPAAALRPPASTPTPARTGDPVAAPRPPEPPPRTRPTRGR